jgi:hypothetical protein
MSLNVCAKHQLEIAPGAVAAIDPAKSASPSHLIRGPGDMSAPLPAIEELSATLAQAGLNLQLTAREVLTSSVTTAWGVAWSEAMIARDLMQNFFDANRGALDQVRTGTWSGGVQIGAPAPFALDRLFFLGSEKGSDDVGQYGEGFKAAAICLLRDHGVQPVCISGPRGVVLSVSPQAVADTALRPVMYQFFDVSPALAGTVLLLPTRSPRLIDAIRHGLDDFLHAGNPVLGAKIFESDDLALYHSLDGNGHLFYRHLRRCTLPGYPLVWVVRNSIATVERRTSQDRDRNAFGDTVRSFYLRGFLQMGMRRYWMGWPQACQAIVQAGQPHWERGHPVLAELAQQLEGYRGNSVRKTLAELFKGACYARAGRDYTAAARQLEIDAVEKAWLKEGRRALPSYFVHLGADQAAAELERRAQQALNAARQSGCRAPTPAERACLDVLGRLLRDYAPDIASIFSRKQCHYTVGNDKTLLGQLRFSRGHGSTEVYLDQSVFTRDLGHAAAVFLHEHAHIFGWDGSRGFTDALTELLETVVREHRQLADYAEPWEQAALAVCKEREGNGASNEEDEALNAFLASLDMEGLRRLLNAVPRASVWTARRSLTVASIGRA